VPQIKLGEAARLTGKAKSTIHRAMEAGRLSYTIDDEGERLIDPAELARAFDIKSPGEAEEVASRTRDESDGNWAQPAASADMAQLIAQLAAERARAEGLAARVADMQETIADLRLRLDFEGEERRQTQARLTALLTDQSTPQRRRLRWWPFGHGTES
jgi:hypothetical protein